MFSLFFSSSGGAKKIYFVCPQHGRACRRSFPCSERSWYLQGVLPCGCDPGSTSNARIDLRQLNVCKKAVRFITQTSIREGWEERAYSICLDRLACSNSLKGANQNNSSGGKWAIFPFSLHLGWYLNSIFKNSILYRGDVDSVLHFSVSQS